MNDKKKNMLSNVKFWAMTCEMEELENEEEYIYWMDAVFKKDGKVYGFIIETEPCSENLKLRSFHVQNLCDYVYVVIDDSGKRQYAEEHLPPEVGILCYSNAFGLGMVWQEMRKPS